MVTQSAETQRCQTLQMVIVEARQMFQGCKHVTRWTQLRTQWQLRRSGSGCRWSCLKLKSGLCANPKTLVESESPHGIPTLAPPCEIKAQVSCEC